MNKIIGLNVILAITVMFLTYQMYASQVMIADLHAKNEALKQESLQLEKEIYLLKQRINTIKEQSNSPSISNLAKRNRLPALNARSEESDTDTTTQATDNSKK